MTHRTIHSILQWGAAGTAALALAVVLSSCKKDAPAGPKEDLPVAAVSEAKEIFTNRCVTCHGQTGKGDGVAAVALNPKPRAFGDGAWQKSITDEHIEKIIVGGGAAVGKSALMPPNPDLQSKPMVVKALRAHVRSFAK